MQFFIPCNFFCQKYKFTYLPEFATLRHEWLIWVDIPQFRATLKLRRYRSPISLYRPSGVTGNCDSQKSRARQYRVN